MKKFWVEYAERWQDEPLAYWVHRERGNRPWYEANDFAPPAPNPVPGKGYAIYSVEIDGMIFRFSSIAQLEHCIDILGRKLLPRTIDLSADRGTSKGPNSHWLSRLPKKAKPWRYREKATKYLREVLAEIQAG